MFKRGSQISLILPSFESVSQRTQILSENPELNFQFGKLRKQLEIRKIQIYIYKYKLREKMETHEKNQTDVKPVWDIYLAACLTPKDSDAIISFCPFDHSFVCFQIN